MSDDDADYAQRRVPYEHGELHRDDLDSDPFRTFDLWFEAAQHCGSREPHAVTLSTADAQARPSSRVVLLKHHGRDGFRFFTNYESRKGRELIENPHASLLFFWESLERQVRVEGTVSRTTDAVSDEYFRSRSRESQISAACSPQSREVENRDSLERLRETLEAEHSSGEIPRPRHWGGFQLVPVRFEFWQGRPSRFHDRFLYEAVNGDWKIRRIAP